MSIDTLLSNLTSGGVTLWLDGDNLRYRAPVGTLTSDLRTAMVTYKAELIEILRKPEPVDDARYVEYDPPAPCPGCGGLMFWWSFGGGRHCVRCEPPLKSIQLLRQGKRIRKNLGVPANPTADRMLIDLHRHTSNE